ncbi:MAG TPA: hypothetical protein VHU19_14030 [Pyrinomonadaceae bacterium]|nr:hypothetical protein [Pyrinomonadaceae bacterium]
MGAAETQQQSVAVLYLRPFDKAAPLAPEVRFTSDPRRVYEQGHVDAFLLIIHQLLADLARKEAEIEYLRRDAEDARRSLTGFQMRAADLIVGWEAT